ncbi:L-lactate dehydrogenase [Longilinea arvoryzae]|uniref:L-lactate dehydrogenase n=1 Tax=Longilinea arvoryzae TaxID=360412 RepID=A0A0S7BMD3_9CHLR|nr:L-lactate dehydrogenase [Longilinea arvoryzae]GAP15163.1 L-lactate dehydrogenase [Longilinea arvoryzae]
MTHIHGHPTRVAIIGAGNVGATFAYALLLSGLSSEIVLIDANQAKAEGEAMDLMHAVPLGPPTRVLAGGYEDCAGAAVTVVTAGSAQRPGETRLDLAARNTEIFRQIIPNIVRNNPDGILVIATNPVDVLTFASQKFSGLPFERVIGSGTILDTARFRYLLSQHFGVDPRSVHAFIIGEHGDSEVPVWSLANLAGMRLPVYCAANGMHCTPETLTDIFQQTRDAAYHIIERKGATFYAIASGLTRLVEAIVRDQSTVMSVSSRIQNYYGISDVCFSLPTVIDGGGVERVIQLELDTEELDGLKKSAEVLKNTIHHLKLD